MPNMPNKGSDDSNLVLVAGQGQLVMEFEEEAGGMGYVRRFPRKVPVAVGLLAELTRAFGKLLRWADASSILLGSDMASSSR